MRTHGIWIAFAALTGCASSLRVAHPVAQNRDLDAFAAASAYPNADDAVLLVAALQFTAAHRDYEGYLHFRRLAEGQPDRPLLRSLEGMMQARVADHVALLQRVAWVEDAIAKLDRGAEGAPLLGRYIRGMVFAELPERFGTARRAIADLERSLAQRDAFPFDPERGIYRALASAYRTLGDPRAADMLRRAGATTDGIVVNASVGGAEGYRFSEPRLVREADGVYVAEGFDMSNIAFIVGDDAVVAIDAGSTEHGARAALQALRAVTRAPIRYLILTHAHWDHVGGAAAIRDAGTVVIAQANFPRELRRVAAFHAPFRWFFGTGAATHDVAPDRLVSTEERLRLGELDIRLIPAPSGETQDALFIFLPRQGLLFVGDVFMPYVGAPFAGEGSPEGSLEAIAAVRRLAPRRLIHGHPPLTRYFTVEAMPGLETALRATYEHALEATRTARPLADLLADNFLPASLRDAPAAVQPYLVVRDNFIAQVVRQHGGRWAANGEGMSLFTRREWAAVLDALAGQSPGRFADVAESLLANGDAPLAYEIVLAGLAAHPSDGRLLRARTRTLVELRERYQTINPFRFIVYSELASRPLPAVVIPPRDTSPPAGLGSLTPASPVHIHPK